MTKQTRKYIIYISIVVAFSAVAIYFVLKDDAADIWKTLINANPWYLLIGVGMMLASYVTCGLLLMLLARLYNKTYKLREAIANHLIGVFFSGITPSATGGQFVQAYTFTKQKIGVSNAASILFMLFIIRQFASICFSGVTFILRFESMRSLTQVIDIFGISFDIIMLAALGFAINTLVLVGLFFLAFSKKLHYIVVHGGVGFLRKIHVYSEEKAIRKKSEIDTKVATFRIELRRILTNWKVLIVCILLVVVDMIICNSYPYVMGLAVGANITNSYFDGLCMANFVNIITMMIPIPGAAGGAELVFQMMFTEFLGADLAYVNSINLLWRCFTFYFNVLIGALVFIFYRGSPKKEAMEVSSRTMLDIEVLSLTQEINFSLADDANAASGDKDSKKASDKAKTKKTRKKYRPSVIDEEINENNIEEHFAEVKKELQVRFDNNEKQINSEQEDSKEGDK